MIGDMAAWGGSPTAPLQNPALAVLKQVKGVRFVGTRQAPHLSGFPYFASHRRAKNARKASHFLFVFFAPSKKRHKTATSKHPAACGPAPPAVVDGGCSERETKGGCAVAVSLCAVGVLSGDFVNAMSLWCMVKGGLSSVAVVGGSGGHTQPIGFVSIYYPFCSLCCCSYFCAE